MALSLAVLKSTIRVKDDVHLTTAMSLCLDLPDCDYEWLQFSGTWSRERHLKVRKLEQGITAINSTRVILPMNTIHLSFKTTYYR